MTALFREARRLMGERNLAIHSPMYAYPGGGNTRRTRIPDDALKYVDADGIYELADELFELARELMAASVRLPRFLDEARRGAGARQRRRSPSTRNGFGTLVSQP